MTQSFLYAGQQIHARKMFKIYHITYSSKQVKIDIAKVAQSILINPPRLHTELYGRNLEKKASTR